MPCCVFRSCYYSIVLTNPGDRYDPEPRSRSDYGGSSRSGRSRRSDELSRKPYRDEYRDDDSYSDDRAPYRDTVPTNELVKLATTTMP